MASSTTAPDDNPRIIRFSQITESPWINGKGSVRVIATGNGRTDNEWDWRLSIADVEQPGKFSRLPDVERVLTVVDGGPLQLTIDGMHHAVATYQPFTFDGGAVTTAALPRGPVRNLNLMCRTGHVEGQVSVLPLREQALFLGQTIILLDGNAQTAGTELRRFDAVVAAEEETFSVCGRGTVAVVTLVSNSSAAGRKAQ